MTVYSTVEKNNLKRLRSIFGKENVKNSPVDKLSYSYDAGMTGKPSVCVFAENKRQIQDCVTYLYSRNIPIIARGRGSGLAGGCVPLIDSVVINTERMNKIELIDSDNLIAIVEPGVITGDIHKAVESKNCFYPPDPASSEISTIGGNISLNSGGLRGFKYGVTADYVKSLEFVGAYGKLMVTGANTVKGVVAYNIKNLFVGSEGTLGIITKAVLKLIPLPKVKKCYLLGFSENYTPSDAVNEIISSGIDPCTLEFIDSITVKALEDYFKKSIFADNFCCLLCEIDGDEGSVEYRSKIFENLFCNKKMIYFESVDNENRRNELFSARRSVHSAMTGIMPNILSEDIVVPRTELTGFQLFLEKLRNKYDIKIAGFGHAGDGNVHVTFIYDKENPVLVEKVLKAVDEVLKETLKMGGTISGEHGIGFLKRKYLNWEISPALNDLMFSVKKAFDPLNLFNPGKAI